MKTKKTYKHYREQITEHDCVPTSFINALISVLLPAFGLPAMPTNPLFIYLNLPVKIGMVIIHSY